ncbi:MAG: DUF433 domain-containing protein [Candidatus Eremiobacterota bacterium]
MDEKVRFGKPVIQGTRVPVDSSRPGSAWTRWRRRMG